MIAVGFGLHHIGNLHSGGVLYLQISVSLRVIGFGTLVLLQLLSKDHNVCFYCWGISWSEILRDLNYDGSVT